MRQSNSGTTLPTCSAVWLNAAQGLATNTAYAPAHIGCPGARLAGGVVVVTPAGPLPLTAAGCAPTVTAYVDADDFVTLLVSNNNANALDPLGAYADVTFNVIYFPLVP